MIGVAVILVPRAVARIARTGGYEGPRRGARHSLAGVRRGGRRAMRRGGVHHCRVTDQGLKGRDFLTTRAAAGLIRAVFGGQVAQLVEQRTENPRVGGSIPPLATINQRVSFALCGLLSNISSSV
jgi:hypothetical protein